MTDDEQKGAAAAGLWVWTNYDLIKERLAGLTGWFRRGDGTARSPGILILGPGGAGKSTLAQILSTVDYSLLRDLPGDYQESLRIEKSALADDPRVEMV